MASSVAHEFNNLMTIVLAGIERAHAGGRCCAPRTEPGPRRMGRTPGGKAHGPDAELHPTPIPRSAAAGPQHVAGGHRRSGRLRRQGSRPHGGALRLAPAPAPVEVDAGQLEIALLNLIRNAAEATSPGSTIRRARRRPHRSAVSVAVHDTGVGMAPGGAAPRLRAVLHHAHGEPWRGARPFDGPRLRRTVRRPAGAGERTRAGDHGPHRPAATKRLIGPRPSSNESHVQRAASSRAEGVSIQGAHRAAPATPGSPRRARDDVLQGEVSGYRFGQRRMQREIAAEGFEPPTKGL